MSAIDEAGTLAHALAVRREVEQNDAEAALAEMLRERRHERSFAGPSVNEEDRGAIPCRFRREHVGLELAFRRSHTRRYRVAEMKSRPLDQQVVVGAPVLEKRGVQNR